MANSHLVITDGTTIIDLLDAHSWTVKNWQPAIADIKGGGSFRSSPLTDGRRLANRRFDNAIETFDMVLSSGGQNTLIYELQELMRLLQKATEYWTTDWQNVPVWLEAQGPCEDEMRYATIVDYRLSGLNSPYAQPFYNVKNMVAMDGLTLVIERRHWQDTEPGAAGTCVQVSASQHYPEIGTLLDGTFEPQQSSDDCEVWTNKDIDLADAKILVGNFEGEDACAGIRFDNVTVPAGAIITQAYVTFVMGNDVASPMDVVLNWQDMDAGMPATFDGTWLDWISRQRLTATGLDWRIETWNDTDPRTTPSLVDWVQETVDSAVWVAPGSMTLFVCPASWGGVDLLSFYAYDNLAAQNPPQLYIEWTLSEGTEIGRTATCLNEVFVANKHNQAPINHIYYYDTSLAAWSGNLIGDTVYPYDIMPGADTAVTPATGDLIYFGSVKGPFNTIIFDLITAQTGITAITWAYYNGAGWTNFSVNPNNGDMCGNTLLDEDGVTVITFKQPENWSTTNAAPAIGVTAYWIRATLTVPVAATAARQQNRDIYTAVLPYVDIAAAQVKGDIPALARTIFDSNACVFRPMATLTMGLRSMDRGEDFTAYLNCSDEQNPTGVTFYSTDLFPVTDASEAPTGRNIISDSTFDYNVFTNVCYWIFSPSMASQYPGVYHAFVRVRQTAGEEQQVRFRLRAVYGTGYNVSYSDTNVTFDISQIIAVDLGQLVIPAPYVMRPGDQVSSMRIYLDAMLVNTTDEDEVFEVYDVVLIPTDEWVGTFAGTPEGTALTVAYEGKRVDVDAITNPRMYRAMLNTIISDTSETIDAELFRIASANPILQSNEDQRMWFLQTYDTELYSYFESNGTVRMQRSARYLAMRGDR